MRTNARALTALVAGGVFIAGTTASYADDVTNNIDITADATYETIALNAGGATQSVSLHIVGIDGDGRQNCNVNGSSKLTITLASSNTSVATVSPASQEFLGCGSDHAKSFTVTPLAEGAANFTASGAATSRSGTMNYAPANFTVNVSNPAPANTAPTVTVSGVTAGASYNKGSVPTATCDVVDSEDGNSSFAATLGDITGDYATDGIGSRTASCEYTDGGGLREVASATFSIVDPSAPAISSRLTPADPDGDNGWYKSNVGLDWTVSEPQSPNSLLKTGCVDQNITADQLATSYSCSASSAGGSADEQSVTIKRDGTAPTVSYTSASGTAGSNGWYKSNVTATFTGTDATSGLADTTGTDTSTADGAAVVLSSPAFTDRAGNTRAGGAASETFKIDSAAPSVSADQSNDTWTNAASVTSDLFTASDATSGLADADKSFELTASAESQSTAGTVVTRDVTDRAGNTSTAKFTALIDRTNPTVSLNVGTNGLVNGASYWTTGVPTAPTCSGNDGLSGLVSCTISGYSAAAGSHTVTATATDRAGNVATASLRYTVREMTHTGFYAPVDMNGVYNVIKGGSSVPLKFNVKVDGVEQTDTSVVTSFKAGVVSCLSSAGTDEVEITNTGDTSLRYDTTAPGQFIQNWKTATGAGTCYKATATLSDGDTISALFKLR